jgi:hypothetical protein
VSEPKRAWANFLWHKRLRCIYAVVPKSGTTSIKRWFVATHPQFQGPAVKRNVHLYLRMRVAMSWLEPHVAEAHLQDPSIYKFTFVRNPWTRLVSGYLDKVVGVEATARKLIRGHYARSWTGGLTWRAHRVTGGINRLYERGLTFREFVEALAAEDPNAVNPHFRLQTRILQNVPLDFVGQIERFAADFAQVQQRLGDHTPAAAEHKQQYARDASDECAADWPVAKLKSLAAFPHWRRFYPPDIEARVRQIFADDFAAFGYANHLGQQPEKEAAGQTAPIRGAA